MAALTDIDVGGSYQISEVATASARTTCALNSNGQVKCWGTPNKGETGYGDSLVYGDNESPAGRAFLDFGEKVVSLSGGGFTDFAIYCALTESSQIYCWGNGEMGGLLRGSTDNTFVSNNGHRLSSTECLESSSKKT